MTSNGSASRISRRPPRAADAIDGFAPREVACPRTVEEVVALVRDARDQRLVMEVVGGATTIGAGNPPRALDVLVSTCALDAVLERNPDDMTVTAQAGVTLAQAAAVLAGDRQRLALDAYAPDRATLGGLVAANATGGLAYGFGTPRDLVLGLTVVDGRGRILNIGGKVVKNVAGYDLVRLFTGSFGTLGVICQLTLRTHPLAEVAATLAFRFADAADLDRARAAIFHCELPLAAFDLVTECSGGESDWRMVVRVEGTAEEVDYQRRRLRDLCGSATLAESTDSTSPFLVGEGLSLIARFAALPDQLVTIARELCDVAGVPVRIAARLGDGALRLCTRASAADDLVALGEAARAIAARHGTTYALEHAPAGLKARFAAADSVPAGFALMRGLKQTFDPDGVFAPGRFLGGL